MNKRKNESEDDDTRPKALKPNEEFDKNGLKSLSPIFKLHALACDDLFEYLSFKDLHSLGQTCKRMNQLTGLYSQENFRDAWLENWNNCITINLFKANGFSHYAENVSIYLSDLKQMRYFESKFRSIKNVQLIGYFDLTDSMIDCLKKILSKVESIEFIGFHFTGKFYQEFSKYSPKLKSLRIISPTPGNWFFQKYVELEYMSIPFDLGKLDDVKFFLEQNTKIKSLEINAKFLFTNQKSFCDINAKIDELTIHTYLSEDLESICMLLNKLHDQHFYKRLRLIICGSDQKFADLLTKLPQTERINAYTSDENIIWPVMKNLKEVEFGTLKDFGYVSLVSNAINIEYAILSVTKFDKILYLISHSKKLKKIKIEYFDDVLDILTLNKARKNLNGAPNVIIYLGEEAYLRTKWMFGNTEFEFIEIRRFGQKSTISIA